MKNCTIFLVGMSICMIGCGQNHNQDSAGMSRETLTCLILGYDSVIYYTGESKLMQDLHEGKITDTAFVAAMFQKIKSANLSLVLKPGGGADMVRNFQEIVNFANNYGAYRRSVDSGDANEDKAFSFVTPLTVRAAMRGENQPPLKLNLQLPRDEPANANTLSILPNPSQIVILISGNNNIYVYSGSDLTKGKKYTYQEITDLVREKKPDKKFSVVIKAAKNTSYKNTVEMLDVMTTQQMPNYALIDITKEEENYLKQLYP